MREFLARSREETACIIDLVPAVPRLTREWESRPATQKWVQAPTWKPYGCIELTTATLPSGRMSNVKLAALLASRGIVTVREKDSPREFRQLTETVSGILRVMPPWVADHPGGRRPPLDSKSSNRTWASLIISCVEL